MTMWFWVALLIGIVVAASPRAMLARARYGQWSTLIVAALFAMSATLWVSIAGRYAGAAGEIAFLAVDGALLGFAATSRALAALSEKSPVR